MAYGDFKDFPRRTTFGKALRDKVDDVIKTITDTSEVVQKTGYNSKITQIKGKIPSITDLATTAAFNAVENKIPNVNNLVKKQIMMQKYQTRNLNISQPVYE